jgi:hypothetical protein
MLITGKKPMHFSGLLNAALLGSGAHDSLPS